MIKLVTIGHLLEETICYPNAARKGPVLGGPAAYAAVAAAKLGIETGLVTKISYEMPGELLTVLDLAKVDQNGVHFERTGTRNELYYDKNGDKELNYISYASTIGLSDIPAPYRSAEMFMICPVNYEVGIDTLQELNKLNSLIFVDLGGYGGAASKRNYMKIADRISYIKQIACYADIVKVSSEDCCRIFGRQMETGEMLGEVASLGIGNFILTLGKDGAIVQQGFKQSEVRPYASNTVDVTGAGDVWCGAFLYSYNKNASLVDSAHFASAAASIFIEQTGGVTFERMPALQQVLDRLEMQIIENRL